ncbi:MAG: hypothetical protein ACI8XO_003938 [Verrucomicrobiales bacterium]|jgi:hypothetical protein
MTRSKKKNNKGAAPGGKKKKKYGLRDPVKPKGEAAKEHVATKKKDAGARKKTAKKKKRARHRDPNTEAEVMWDGNYARCQALHAEDPHSWWEGMTGEDHAFGAWLQTQRYNRKIGRLRSDREQRLKKVAFVWDTIEATWELHLKALKKFIRSKTAGKAWWKNLATADAKLDLWCDAQRRAKSHGELAENRQKKLDEIDFVWSVLDATWELRFEELREFIKGHPSGRVGKDNAPKGLLFWTNTQRRKWLQGELDPERERRLEEIGFKWDGRKAKSDEIWEGHFEDLAAFHQLTGNANPGPDDDDETFSWLVHQRRRWHEMPEERRTRLVSLGVSETTPAGQALSRASWKPDWDKFFKDATAFKKKFGHLRIGRDRDSAKFPGLANFAGKLRSGTLEPHEAQQERLEEMEFGWDIRSAKAEAFFDERFEQLVKYKQAHGDTNVSQLSKTHKALGQWVNRTRQMRNELTEEQRGRLDGLGFVWELMKEWMEGQWEIRFSELLEYKKQNSDTLVPQECPEWYTLSRWVSRMRQTKKGLSKERIARLDEVGFVWNAKAAERAATEELRYQELAAFVQEHGHARVTRGNDPTGGSLNSWIVRQREKKKKDKMEPELEKKLEILGFLWTKR